MLLLFKEDDGDFKAAVDVEYAVAAAAANPGWSLKAPRLLIKKELQKRSRNDTDSPRRSNIIILCLYGAMMYYCVSHVVQVI